MYILSPIRYVQCLWKSSTRFDMHILLATINSQHLAGVFHRQTAQSSTYRRPYMGDFLLNVQMYVNISRFFFKKKRTRYIALWQIQILHPGPPGKRGDICSRHDMCIYSRLRRQLRLALADLLTTATLFCKTKTAKCDAGYRKGHGSVVSRMRSLGSQYTWGKYSWKRNSCHQPLWIIITSSLFFLYCRKINELSEEGSGMTWSKRVNIKTWLLSCNGQNEPSIDETSVLEYDAVWTGL